jgi:hypothetical protein
MISNLRGFSTRWVRARLVFAAGFLAVALLGSALEWRESLPRYSDWSRWRNEIAK